MITLRNHKDKKIGTLICKEEIVSAIACENDRLVFVETIRIPHKFFRFSFSTSRNVYKTIKEYGIQICIRTRGVPDVYANYKEDEKTRDEDLATMAQ